MAAKSRLSPGLSPDTSLSAATCFIRNWSYGMSAFIAAITQSRYVYANGYRRSSWKTYPFVSLYRATSSQCRPHRSPYRGLASRRSTTFSYALEDESFTNASTSAGVGGRPVRSKVTRRIKAPLGAEGLGASPSVSRRDVMKLSIGFLAESACLTAGTAGTFGATK